MGQYSMDGVEDTATAVFEDRETAVWMRAQEILDALGERDRYCLGFDDGRRLLALDSVNRSLALDADRRSLHMDDCYRALGLDDGRRLLTERLPRHCEL